MDPLDKLAATEKEAELGRVAFLTPLSPKRRRPAEEVPAQPRRPDGADAEEESDGKDLGAFEEKMVCRVYYNLERMLREAGGPILKNHDWFAENTDGPMRKIVSEFCGVGRTAVGKYLKEHKEGGGVLGSALPRGPAKKDPREIATKSAMPDGETIYDTTLGRISAVHREGRVGTARNLPR